MSERPLADRVLAVLGEVRAARRARRADGISSNCGLGLPYWQLAGRLGIRGPLARLRLRLVVGALVAEGRIRSFTACDTAAGVGRVVEAATPAR